MTDYTITTNFGAKDSLPSGNAGKVIKGSEFTTEFTNIQTAVNTKADTAGDTFTGAVNFSADVAVNTNTLFVDVSENRVGIGTTSFTSKFHVGGDMTDFVYSEPAGDSIATFAPITTGSSSAMNVNIGSGMYGGAGVETARLNFLNGHGNDGFATGFSIKSYKTASATATDEYLAFEEISRAGNTGVTHNERMRIDASGNVGIGTTAKIGAGSGYVGNTTAASSGTLELWTTAGDVELANNWALGNILFRRGTTEAMRIDSSSNLWVGTTDQYAFNGGFTVQTGTVPYINVGHASSVASGNYYAAFRHGTNTIGTITQNGTTSILYNTSSDERLKENITDSADAGSKVDAIQIRQYDWKADGSHQDYGVIAQELLEVAPEAVHQPVDEEDMMGVDYSKLVPMLIKEVQSLRSRVAELENV